ncbi:MAG: peptidoglycan DD-metalloendopeptidase family protein [Proteobacteria bacterium]|nr:peptidoglycan DD-metalloendopeptidase family protein [Pseudomonadota bacterium]MBU1639964.1 peptidoglycan DD-metalloendopeptidase family protein [Pseudomonadota bacterium]
MTCGFLQRPLFWALFITLLHGTVFVGPTLAYERSDDFGLEEAVRLAEQDLFEHKKKLSRIQQGLQVQQENFEQTRKQEENLLNELVELDDKIIEESTLLVSLYNQLQVEELKTDEMQAALEEIKGEKDILARQTEKRLAAYYRLGDIGVLNITFSSTTLPELVNFHEYYRHMLRHDQTLIARFRGKLVELEESRKSHEAQQATLEDAVNQAKNQQQVLAETKLERRDLLTRIKAEKNLYRQAADQLEESAKALISGLEELEKQAVIAHQQKEEWMITSFPLEPHKKRKPAWMRGFGGQQGLLPPPVVGTLINLFGASASSVAGETKPSYGVDFKSEPGSIIRAIFKGKVVHTGFVKGYGQLIIISHTDGYYTMTSGMTTFLVKPGDIVNQGDEIAMVSGHIGELRSAIHFEIRLKTQPEDPLAWLDPNSIVLAPGLQQTP